jgi:hypothetical protein
LAKAIFHREVNIRRGPICWHIKPGPAPQSFPRKVIEQAVREGAATIVAQKRTTPAPQPDQPG